MRAIAYSCLIFFAALYCVQASDWPQQKLESYFLQEATLEAAVQQLSDSISPDSAFLSYTVLPSSVSYDLQVPSGYHDSLVEQLLGRGLKKVAQKEQDYQFEKTKISILLRNSTARDIASHLFEYFDCQYRVSGNTLIFQRNDVIKVNQIKVSSDLMGMIEAGKTRLPFPEDMFILVPHRNLILVAHFDSKDVSLHEIQEMEEGIIESKEVKETGEIPTPFQEP